MAFWVTETHADFSFHAYAAGDPALDNCDRTSGSTSVILNEARTQ
jgi:hypothetical protein